jgi:subtilase family serine protease
MSIAIRCKVDFDSTITESNETNNEIMREITIGANGLNLKFSSIMVLPLNPRTSDTTTISAYIVNTGSSATPATTATLQLNGEASPVVFSVAALQPYATATIQRKCYFTTAEAYSVKAIVDPDNIVSETDETDNESNKSFNVTMRIGL